jgi:hypothetical protein
MGISRHCSFPLLVAMNPFSIVFSLLRDRDTFIEEIHENKELDRKISALLMSSFAFFALYGAIIGSFHGIFQLLSSAIKLPILYLVTLLITLPTLYIFNVLFGSKRNIVQHLAYLLTAVSVIALLLCGFAPVTLFFLVTVNDYHFFLLLNVAILGLTGILGISFLYRVMRPISDNDSAQGVKIRTNILRFWLCLYGFVGSQLGWTLRPFFGTPGQFELFRQREGSFFSAVWDSLLNLLNL